MIDSIAYAVVYGMLVIIGAVFVCGWIVGNKYKTDCNSDCNQGRNCNCNKEGIDGISQTNGLS